MRLGEEKEEEEETTEQKYNIYIYVYSPLTAERQTEEHKTDR